MAPSEVPLYRTTRSASMSSDRPSSTGYGGLLSPPVATSPEPAFIAPSAASQIVTNDHDSQADVWYDQHGIEPSGETALVAPPALKLVNRFLDQLLFNFLLVARSTSLASLRPAVGEVLKPKLANDAINGADQELHEYLGGGEDEEMLALHGGPEPSNNWDLELVWKRTRLRCMVYSSLGDMEEEDEDFYTEREQLDPPPGTNGRPPSNPGVVSPAVAIFLTSILEFMGEQVLLVAGHAAYHRLRLRHEREERDGSITPADIAERVVVEESDMERVALDRTLGRLWRGWKKRIRSPTNSVSMSRSFSRESTLSDLQNSGSASVEPEDNIAEDLERPSIAAVAVLAEHEYAAGIPLPLSDDDVREIEIPGLAKQPGDEEDEVLSDDKDIRLPQRPRSLIIFDTRAEQDILTPTLSRPQIPQFLTPTSRKRSNSLPSPTPSPYTSTPSKTLQAALGEVDEDQDGKKIAATDEESSEQTAVKTEEGPHGEEDVEETVEPKEPEGLVVGLIAGAAALGAGAVAAANHHHHPQAAVGQDEETSGEEEFIEEPQIMTSSRVSINGRKSPEDSNSPSRQSSVRSHGGRSLRLIDVPAPKSPAVSTHRDIDASDYIAGRSVIPPRPKSLNSPIDQQAPLLSSPISRVANASPISRVANASPISRVANASPISRVANASPRSPVGSSISSRHARNSAADSISEEEEEEEEAVMTPVVADHPAAVHGVDVETAPTARQIAPEPTSRGIAPEAASAFILSAPPLPRNARVPSGSPVNDQPATQPNANYPLRSKAPGLDNGIPPPLTPLSETTEVAPHTSDEAKSSSGANGISENGIKGHAPSVSGSSLNYSQRVPDQQRSIRTQTTNGLRSSPPRPSREDQARKELTSKAHRRIHPSGSGSGSSSASHKVRPVRTSEEMTPNGVEDKSQSFEQLIRSDQTIQYTLTPQNMRNIEGGSPEFPRVSTPVILNSQDGHRTPTRGSQSSSNSKYTGLHSNAVVETPNSAKSASAFRPNSITPSGSRSRPNAPQPRDARVERQSMVDLAEFISSTAPPGSDNPLPTRGAPPSVNGHRGLNGTAHSGSSSTARVGTATSVPKRTDSVRRNKLQARDAAVPRGESISDIIDFVRSGPQLEKDHHRIPRTVAPFRTTMDSDQMSGAVGGKAIDASLPDPRYSQTSTSLHSSVNSQSALLNSSSKTTSKPQGFQKSKDSGEGDRMPTRKSRRPRDMYDIDFSDEEDDYETMARPKPIKEESLVEFLASVPPPPGSAPTPIFDVNARPAGPVRKKSSTPNLMSRFGRRDSTTTPPPKPKSSGQDSHSPAPRPPPLPAQAPIAVQITNNRSPPPQEPARGTGGNYVSQVDSARNKVGRKSYQPRDAINSSSRTDDLAAFLRTEPPSSMLTPPQASKPTLQKEEASTFQRFFGRKKVH